MPAIGLLEEIVLNRLPKFMRGKNLGRLLKAFAVTLDGNVEVLRQGMTFNNPLLCPRELLPTIAKDRRLPIPPSMPEEGARDMLAGWLQLHRARASSQGVLRHVRNYFAPGPYPSIQLVHENGTTATWHKVDSAGRYTKTPVVPSNWDYDGLHQWAKWYLISEAFDDSGVPIPASSFYDTWDGDDTWDDHGTMWDTMTSQSATDLASMAIDWKRAGTRLQAAILNRKPGSIGPGTALVTDTDGWTTLPTGGNWNSTVYTSGPFFGQSTRPPYLDWFYDRS
jgi:hypothetical protein